MSKDFYFMVINWHEWHGSGFCCNPYVLLFQVQSTGEGEAQRYFDHALTLRNTILFLRHNKDLVAQTAQPDQPSYGMINILEFEDMILWNFFLRN